MPFRVGRWFLLLESFFINTSQSLPELRLERSAGPSLSMIWLALGREGTCWYPFVRRPW